MRWLSPNTVSSKFSLLNDKPKFSALEGNCLIYIFFGGMWRFYWKKIYNLQYDSILIVRYGQGGGGHSSDLINV